MLRSVKDLCGYAIRATDGKIGEVEEFYFDDQEWIVRYLVVNTSPWLVGRRVLIAPEALGPPAWQERILPVALDKEQIKNSPSIDTHKPVSRQKELELRRYYAWPNYWQGQFPFGGAMTGLPPAGAPGMVITEKEERSGDPHLRSTQEVIGYNIEAVDGKIGHVEDFLVDDAGWTLRYMIVDAKNWWPGGFVLVSPRWIERVSWSDQRVVVKLSRASIRQSPPYDRAKEVSREYESKLYDSYGQPKYWKE